MPVPAENSMRAVVAYDPGFSAFLRVPLPCLLIARLESWG